MPENSDSFKICTYFAQLCSCFEDGDIAACSRDCDRSSQTTDACAAETDFKFVLIRLGFHQLAVGHYILFVERLTMLSLEKSQRVGVIFAL